MIAHRVADELDDPPPVASRDDGGRAAFARLHPAVRRAVGRLGWTRLRPVQVAAIEAWHASGDDLIVIAGTAAGKTEAVFLPVLSSLLGATGASLRALVVAPLKSLVNDQHERLAALARGAAGVHGDVPVHRWHGDVPASEKRRMLDDPRGVLVITPESIEAMLIHRPWALPRLVGRLETIVIDEVHAFLGTERGRHLASVLVRLARYRDAAAPRLRTVALSATLGDPVVAQRFLRPDAPSSVRVITAPEDAGELHLRLYAYDADRLGPDRRGGHVGDHEPESTPELVVLRAIASELARRVEDGCGLVFAESRGDVELTADLANEACREHGRPERFLVHHGSLDRSVRHDAERRLKHGRERRTVICSSTLELGIDVGRVAFTGQVGAPRSVAALRQRAGRSGRDEGAPRRLRLHVDASRPAGARHPISRIPVELLQAIAVAELLVEGRVEPLGADAEHVVDLSTFTHQVISTVLELGAVTAADLHRRLCVEGPFRGVTADLCARALRALGDGGVLEQGADGHLLLGPRGEALCASSDVHAAFAVPTALVVEADGTVLGTLPALAPPRPGDLLVFAARRWQVGRVDVARGRLSVAPAARPQRPTFFGEGGPVHAMVVERMRRVLADRSVPRWLDHVEAAVLADARAEARAAGLARRTIVAHPAADDAGGGCDDAGTYGGRRSARSDEAGGVLSGARCTWLCWSGTTKTRFWAAVLRCAGIDVEEGRIGLACAADAGRVREAVQCARAAAPPMLEIARAMMPRRGRKHDDLLADDLLVEARAAELAWVPPPLDDRRDARRER